MGLETAAMLAIGGAAASGAFSQIGIGLEHQAQKRAMQDQSTELLRQRDIAVDVANQRAHDRVLEAGKQFSTLAAALAGEGATDTLRALTNELNYLEGTDLNRIVTQRDNEIAGFRAEARALRKAGKNLQKQTILRRLSSLTGTATKIGGVGLSYHAIKGQQATLTGAGSNSSTASDWTVG